MSNGDYHNTIIVAADDPDCATHSGILLVVTVTLWVTLLRSRKNAHILMNGHETKFASEL